MIHRPRYDDWSFPKGKTEPGEADEDAPLREVEEETRLRCAARARAAVRRPTATRRDGSKVVRYFGRWSPRRASSSADDGGRRRAAGSRSAEADGALTLRPATARSSGALADGLARRRAARCSSAARPASVADRDGCRRCSAPLDDVGHALAARLPEDHERGFRSVRVLRARPSRLRRDGRAARREPRPRRRAPPATLFEEVDRGRSVIPVSARAVEDDDAL